MALVEAQSKLSHLRLVHSSLAHLNESWKPTLDVNDFLENEDS